LHCIFFFGSQPCPQYPVAWKRLVRQHGSVWSVSKGLRVFGEDLEERKNFSSEVLRENPNAIQWGKLEDEFVQGTVCFPILSK
jgi:hypothetical protein